MIDADAGAEQFRAAARTGRFDDGRFVIGVAAELLGHSGREREDGRRTDDADLITCGCLAGYRYGRERSKRGANAECVH